MTNTAIVREDYISTEYLNELEQLWHSCDCDPYVVRLVTHVVAQEKGAGGAQEVAVPHAHLLAVDGPLDHVAED